MAGFMVEESLTDSNLIADDALRYATECLEVAGLSHEHASVAAEAIWHASMRGVDSHGLRLLPHYLQGLRGGRLNPKPNLTFKQTADSCGIVDADHTLGHIALHRAMQGAIILAEASGVGIVSVANSSHCGALAWYALQACAKGMVGLAATHATSKMKTHGGKRPYFGTNPFCFAAPGPGDAHFCYDAAQTPITMNKVYLSRQTGESLPEGVAANDEGELTTDANAANQLLPIGDYKGFGLAMMVDLVCALLSGMPAGREVSSMFGVGFDQPRKLGQVAVALKVDAFQPVGEFTQRLGDLCDALRSEPALEGQQVMVPGDPERLTYAHRQESGIPMPDAVLVELNAMANDLGVRPPRLLE